MKRLASIALAGLIAGGASAAAVTGADAAFYPKGGGAYVYHPGGGCYGCWHPHSTFNFSFGLAGPAYPVYPAPYVYYAPPPPPPAVYPALSPVEAHVEWCVAQFRSYNPATNTFVGYDGLPHECVGP